MCGFTLKERNKKCKAWRITAIRRTCLSACQIKRYRKDRPTDKKFQDFPVPSKRFSRTFSEPNRTIVQYPGCKDYGMPNILKFIIVEFK